MDEKYCVYDNLVRRKHWVDFDELPQPQPKRPDRDKRSCFPSAGTSMAQYSGSEILRNRNPGRGKILLLMDNARPHTAKNKGQIWYQFTDPGWMEGLVGLGGKSEPGTWYRVHATVSPHPTALHAPTAKNTQKKLKELRIELVPHPPYSPDLAPNHVFRSLQSFLAGRKFANRNEVKRGVSNFLLSKSPKFFVGKMAMCYRS
ncbi:unnamed protein product [Heligmosomoides polygyrus]|uniref:Mariner Mos1 transposase n=1 Tax=Heligmosomoides polygyrus TaxID=6339 RepID=A0A183FKL4_HELPZ|nr:unnamed protein product [Heligmosomoides polygyrus]